MTVKALKYKYLLLSKMMLNLPDEVTNLVSGKLAIRCCNECSVQSITASPRHTGPPVALAAKARILADFQAAVKTFKVQLEDFMIVAKHLTTVYSYMLEHNSCRSVSLLIQQCSMVWGVSCNCIFPCRIIELYSKVQVDYVTGKIILPKPR